MKREMIQEEYCTFETAKLLKKAGFPQDIKQTMFYNAQGSTWHMGDHHWTNGYAKPTQAVAMRWLRDALNIFVKVSFAKDPDGEEDWLSVVEGTEADTYIDGGGFHTSYEAAAEAGIQEACRYLNNQFREPAKMTEKEGNA